jgi:hypothetical protein
MLKVGGILVMPYGSHVRTFSRINDFSLPLADSNHSSGRARVHRSSNLKRLLLSIDYSRRTKEADSSRM